MDDEIKEYYKLKEKYEKTIKRQKEKIIGNEHYSVNQKKKRLKLIESKCVNCGKQGGTLFSNNNRILRVICGNKESPCRLNISINRKDKKYVNSINECNKLYNEINNLKNEIIKVKLDLLFEYITEEDMIKRYGIIKSRLSKHINVYEEIYRHIINEVDNIENMDRIIELETSISMLINNIKDIGDTNKVSSGAREIIEIYINELEPLLRELFEKKYKEAFVMNNKLVQDRYNLKSLEYNILEKR